MTPLATYVYEQGIAKRLISADELFAWETLDLIDSSAQAPALTDAR
jgi:hypothetical protein